jgi:hypothetical protein
MGSLQVRQFLFRNNCQPQDNYLPYKDQLEHRHEDNADLEETMPKSTIDVTVHRDRTAPHNSTDHYTVSRGGSPASALPSKLATRSTLVARFAAKYGNLPREDLVPPQLVDTGVIPPPAESTVPDPSAVPLHVDSNAAVSTAHCNVSPAVLVAAPTVATPPPGCSQNLVPPLEDNGSTVSVTLLVSPNAVVTWTEVDVIPAHSNATANNLNSNAMNHAPDPAHSNGTVENLESNVNMKLVDSNDTGDSLDFNVDMELSDSNGVVIYSNGMVDGPNSNVTSPVNSNGCVPQSDGALLACPSVAVLNAQGQWGYTHIGCVA